MNIKKRLRNYFNRRFLDSTKKEKRDIAYKMIDEAILNNEDMMILLAKFPGKREGENDRVGEVFHNVQGVKLSEVVQAIETALKTLTKECTLSSE